MRNPNIQHSATESTEIAAKILKDIQVLNGLKKAVTESFSIVSMDKTDTAMAGTDIVVTHKESQQSFRIKFDEYVTVTDQEGVALTFEPNGIRVNHSSVNPTEERITKMLTNFDNILPTLLSEIKAADKAADQAAKEENLQPIQEKTHTQAFDAINTKKKTASVNPTPTFVKDEYGRMIPPNLLALIGAHNSEHYV